MILILIVDGKDLLISASLIQISSTMYFWILDMSRDIRSLP